MGVKSSSDEIGLWIFKNTKSNVFPHFVAYSRAPFAPHFFNRVQHKLCCRICANHPESGWLAEKFAQNRLVENWIVRNVLRHKKRGSFAWRTSGKEKWYNAEQPKTECTCMLTHKWDFTCNFFAFDSWDANSSSEGNNCLIDEFIN